MKKKIGLTVLGLLTLYYFLTFTSVDRKHEILNEIIKDNDFRLHKVCTQFEEVAFFDNDLVDFVIWDRLSAQTQKLTNKLYKIRENTIVYFPNGAGKTPVITKLESECDIDREFVYRVSLPIVSYDEKTVLVKITFDCNCSLGGHGGEYLFRMVDGKWRQTNQFNSWISKLDGVGKERERADAQ